MSRLIDKYERQLLWALFLAGAVVLAVLLMISLGEPAPVTGAQPTTPPGKGHPLGTFYGRDTLHATACATRITLEIAVAAVVITMVIGTAVLFLAYRFSLVYQILQGLEAFHIYYVPRLLLLMLAMIYFQVDQDTQRPIGKVPLVILVLGITGVLFLLSQVHSDLKKIQKRRYVYYAVMLNVGRLRIFWQHILRNCSGLWIALAKQARDNIIFCSTLSFLNLIRFKERDLGALVALYFRDMNLFSHWWLFAPCAILTVSIGIFFLGSYFVNRHLNLTDITEVA